MISLSGSCQYSDCGLSDQLKSFRELWKGLLIRIVVFQPRKIKCMDYFFSNCDLLTVALLKLLRRLEIISEC